MRKKLVIKVLFYTFIFFLMMPSLLGCNQLARDATRKTLVVSAGDDILIARRNETVRTANVLANDSAAKAGDILSVVDWQRDTPKGLVNYENDGIFTYDPKPGIDSGPDSFTYVAVDSNGRRATGTVNVTIEVSWGKPSVLSENYKAVKTVKDALDNITVVWTQLPEESLWAKHYDAITRRWGDKQRIDNPLSGKVLSAQLQLVVDQNGRATVVWQQNDSGIFGSSSLYASHMTAAGRWDTDTNGKIVAIPLENKPETIGISGFQLVMDLKGQITVVWEQAIITNNTETSLYANHMTAEGLWNTGGSLVDDKPVGNVEKPQLVVDENGQVTVVWSQYTGGFSGVRNIYANSMTPVGVWKTKVGPFNVLGVGDFVSPLEIIVDSKDQITMAWLQYSTEIATLYVKSMTPAGVWENAVNPLDADLGKNIYQPKLVMGGMDNIMLFWMSSIVGGIWDFYVGYVTSSIGVSRTLLDNKGVGEMNVSGGFREYSYQLGMDTVGPVVAVWKEYDNGSAGVSSLYANRMVKNLREWGGPKSLESGPRDVSDYRVLHSNDKATVVWQQEDNENSVVKSLYAIQWDQNNLQDIPNSTGWGNSGLIENKQTSVSSISALVSNNQNVPVVIWRQADENGNSYLWSKLLNKEGRNPLGEKDAVNWVGFSKMHSDHQVILTEFDKQGTLHLVVNSQSSSSSRTIWATDFR